jgi:CubicO group peptidase (beta-lactamase class C family)
MHRLIPILVATVLFGAPAYAQDKTAEIDKIFAWVKPGMPGCAVAASHNGKQVVNRVYGLADVERDVPITPATRFDVASIRKQFVAAAILLLVEEGKLSLSDDVRKHVPELPDYGHKITLDHMLTHTSGLRDWVPLRNWANGSYDAMTMILRQRNLNFVPGDEWSYSNSGFVLLTEIVTRTSGMKFSDFVRKRLFEPLGMNATTYVDDLRYVLKNRAVAYEPDSDRWRIDMLIDNERGGGGALFSTASDMVVWNDALTSDKLGKFVSEKILEPATLNNGRKLTYARGLSFLTHYAGKLVLHGGGAAAYRSIVIRSPERGLSVAVLCNAGEASDNRDDYAAAIFDLFMADQGMSRPASTPPPANAAGVEAADINSKVGLFFSEGMREPLRLIANNGRLGVAGGGPLVAMSKDHFRNPRASMMFMSNDEFELNFLSPDQFDLKSMEGKTTRYRRAERYAPDVAQLATFSGEYKSDELRATMQITPGKDAVMLRINDSTENLELRPVDRDTFQRGMQTLRFHRDASGKVVGVDLMNPVLRRVTFTRSAS